MQRTTVLVSLNGDVTMQVPKNVTAAEIGVLIMSHGQGSVSEIPGFGRTEGSGKVNHGKEYKRLVDIYGAEPVAKAYGPTPFGVTLPTRINEVLEEYEGPDDDDEDAGEVFTPPAEVTPPAPAAAIVTKPALASPLATPGAGKTAGELAAAAK